MDQKTNLRHLHILQYLYERTDDEHPASTADITEYLAEKGIAVHRQTIASDVELLINFGFDIITVRSRQNQYFYGSRQFELAELKMMVDAIQAARFVTNKKSEVLTNKLMRLTSSHHASKLNRQLFVAGRVKATNESVLYTVDLLYEAISENKRIQFKYYEYTSEKKKILKHKGYLYEFSPYDLAWYNDSYYVFGYSEKHGKVIKFRVDRIYKPNITDIEARMKPEDYDLPTYIRRTFSMYDDDIFTVELKCENSLMNAVIDNFGENVVVRPADCGHFIATVEVSANPPFYAWVFTFGGKIKILSPKSVVDEFKTHLKETLNNQ